MSDPARSESGRPEDRYAAWAKSQPRPPLTLVNQIESLLAKESCVGSLDRWSRSYAYNNLPEKTVDAGIVDFHLEEAGAFGVRPGKHITEPNSWLNIDDRPIRMAEGDYDIRERRLRFAFCGNNVGAKGRDDINNMSTYFDELKRRRAAHRSAQSP